ncbi:hypothetical protein ANCDUO_20220 [Ancylostoma duodenale]|uniref:Arrestin-like N-terminal domain-containing protein n=1 Tax=Ancylostoma duodenale TaxID=51022 RepID=A0A0C2FSR9_9BILA|nr:hypothetical protein ANCDUO_20220 [Ancylostoma duodenale]
MSKNDICFYITFSNPKEVYTPGSVIDGIAHVILAEPTKARSLKITLDGRAYTTWEVSRTRSVT